MAQEQVKGTQLNLNGVDGSGLTNVDAVTLNGETNSNLHDATLLTGIVPSANLTGTYNIDISGNATTATDASSLGGVPAANYAQTTDTVQTSVQASGTNTIAAGTNWVPTAGVYNIIATSSTVVVEVNISGTWYTGTQPSGTIVCDGTNVRITNNDTVSQTVAWQQFK